MRERERESFHRNTASSQQYIYNNFFYRISNKGKNIIDILHDNVLKTVV